MIIILDGFLVLVFAIFAIAFGFSVFNAIAGVASIIISVLAVIVYGVSVLNCFFSLINRIVYFNRDKTFSSLISIIMSLISSILALYMTNLLIKPFVGAKISGAFDLLSAVIVGVVYIPLWSFVFYGWGKANNVDYADGDNVGFSLLGFIIEIAASFLCYVILKFCHII